jgi:uncharacterized protein with HEPN domain
VERGRRGFGVCGGDGLEEFIHDRKTANAVIRSLEVMGEAAKKIPEDTGRYPEQVSRSSLEGNRRDAR